jgi:NAD(P)-dependent dehydrogenase (short-subunit alcohol dehydrogenase family)
LKNKLLRKSVIVTGASSGIGKATVIKLIQSGYQVFGLARRYDKLVNLFSSESVSKENKKEDFYIPIEFDITKPETVNNVLDVTIIEILTRAFFAPSLFILYTLSFSHTHIHTHTYTKLTPQHDTTSKGLVN